ncbi:hypothetical protein T4E_609, partial [Trichinella pseudospiralis]
MAATLFKLTVAIASLQLGSRRNKLNALDALRALAVEIEMRKAMVGQKR